MFIFFWFVGLSIDVDVVKCRKLREQKTIKKTKSAWLIITVGRVQYSTVATVATVALVLLVPVQYTQ